MTDNNDLNKSKNIENQNNKKWYDVNLTKKFDDTFEETKKFKLGLDDNINEIKKKYDKYSRKDINLNFLERITRTLYANDSYLIKLEFIQYVIFIILIYYYNPLKINTNYPVFTNLLVISVSFLYVILFIFIKNKVENNDDVDLINPTEGNVIIKFVSLIVFFVIFMLLIKGFIWLLANTALINIFRNMLAVIIFTCVLSIVNLIMGKTIGKIKNAPGGAVKKLFLKFIMYLPCLLIDIAEYIKYEFNLTTKPVWILLGIEGVLIGLYYILPYLFDKIMTLSGLKLLNQPVYLSKEYTIGNYKQLHKKQNDKIDLLNINLDQLYDSKINSDIKTDVDSDTLDNADNKRKIYTDPNIPKNKYLAWIYNKLKNPIWIKAEMNVYPQYNDLKIKRFRYSYALSGWFYINPQPPNTRTAYTIYTNILRYGNKVNLEYNGQLGSLRVMADVATKGNDVNNKPNDSVEIYETKNVLYQKWNNIVINYDNGYLDVFINGELVGSQKGVAPYMSFDNIVTGAPTGILGGICNVTYYEKPLNKSNIELNYKALRGKKNPYIWRLKDEINIDIKYKKNQKFIDQIKSVLGA